MFSHGGTLTVDKREKMSSCLACEPGSRPGLFKWQSVRDHLLNRMDDLNADSLPQS